MKKINISGTIVSNSDKQIYEWYGMDATSPNDVNKIVNTANGEDLEITINSGGGSVFAGSEIYTTIKDYIGNTVVKIVGFAGSAASVIAMGGKRITMSPTAQIMIHNASGGAMGDYHDMEKTAEILKSTNETIANAYMLKSGMKKEDTLALMDTETWFTAEKALEHKLIDDIMFQNNVQLVASHLNGVLPFEVIAKARDMMKNETDNDKKLQIAKAKVALLKMKGI